MVYNDYAIYYININRFWFEDILETILLTWLFNLKNQLYFLSNVNIYYECFRFSLADDVECI